jgi:hypothetical protein
MAAFTASFGMSEHIEIAPDFAVLDASSALSPAFPPGLHAASESATAHPIVKRARDSRARENLQCMCGDIG